MGIISVKYFYTDLIEHCLSVVICGRNSMGLSQNIINTARKWIESLSESDKDFIETVFSSDYSEPNIGLAFYCSIAPYVNKARRLMQLEKSLAIYCGLIDKNQGNELDNVL